MVAATRKLVERHKVLEIRDAMVHPVICQRGLFEDHPWVKRRVVHQILTLCLSLSQQLLRELVSLLRVFKVYQ